MANIDNSGRIDVHSHYLPPGYAEQATAALGEIPDGMPRMPDWDAASTIAVMDRCGIATAMLSVSSPGVHFGDDDAARGLARSVNEFGARNAQQHHGRFGVFASLPLPNVDSALAEIAYALDVLKADGFVMLTNYRGIYLGDTKFDPVFDELNRRSAIVFMHPTSPSGCEHLALGFPRPMLEFPFDSTRAITNLIVSNTLDRCPNIRLIVPHGGGTLPFLARRIAMVARLIPRPAGSPNLDVLASLRRLFYDTAAATGENQLASMLSVFDSSRILFGSDYPFMPEVMTEAMIAELKASNLLKPNDVRAIDRDNAMKLFTRAS
ncbi:MAG TPA: amidohydrolase family protein [Candidatus Binataceae bacterium]|nr:amidohydrolase family protein [Candidatus Binataceae bacterium]